MGKQHRRYHLLVIITSVIFLSLSITKCLAITGSLSSPYKATTAIKIGSLVSLNQSVQGEIIPADPTNQQRLVGVTVSDQQSLLSVNDATSTTQVVYEGIVNTLVSTINGPINIGSQVSVSPLSGIGAKAMSGNRVIGLAESTFSSSTPGSVSREIRDTSNNLHKIYVGYIPVLIAISSGASGSGSSSGLLNSFRSFVSNIAGHSVSNLVLFLVTAITLLAIISIIVLINGTITGGLISVGRNPLAKSSIMASIGQILIMIVIIAATSVAIIYFVLH